jgi:glutamate-5-semialdehyde dehydrogenase
MGLVEFHAEPRAYPIFSSRLSGKTIAARPVDFDTEYLDLILNVKIVDSVDEAIAHIERHGSRHSEAILTSDEKTARHFQSEVDAAAVYWNASTRFTDGFELGLGGELGISTQKLHVRGPVGLRELTSVRWVIDGEGQIR